MKLYKSLHNLLVLGNVPQKWALWEELIAAYPHIERDGETPIEIFTTPSYHAQCTITSPRDVPPRRGLHTPQGQVILIHAIAHIEYSAIDLALDALYRFRDVGEAFERDWLEVAADEIRHFRMMEKLLERYGSYYGEYCVHDSLFEASMRTTTLLERMAVVPRYLEANGLDATPSIVRKLAMIRDPRVHELIEALEVILREEVDHVRKGDRWFGYAATQAGCDPKSSYFEIIERHYPKSFPRKIPINCTARQMAGFSYEELRQIAPIPC